MFNDNFDNLLIGHITDHDHATGVSVFILPEHSVCGYFIAGSAPATREVNVLEPSASVGQVDALVLSGGGFWLSNRRWCDAMAAAAGTRGGYEVWNSADSPRSLYL